MNAEQLTEALETLFAPWVKALNLKLESAEPGSVTLRLPFDRQLVHAGGVVCGQTWMAVADTAMVLAISADLGGFQPMTTVSLNTSFLRPVSAGDARVTARILRRGKNLVFGAIEILDAEERMVAHATTTYALL